MRSGQFDATDAAYFDGDVPLARAVLSLGLSGDGAFIEITTEDGVIRWAIADVRRVADDAGRGGAMLRVKSDPLARLYTPNPFVISAMPYPNRSAPPKGRGRLAAWALAAVAAVTVQIGVLVPLLADNLAAFIPVEGERALGETTFGHIREALDDTGLNPVAVCDGEEGQAVLDQLAARLTAQQELRQEISVSVLDHKMLNAFALPGGYVVLFKGLIDAAKGPDEVAAVLGHEIGHVVSRDPTRHALRSAGSIGVLGLLFGDFAGGAAVLVLTERLISASYSQGAESGADAFAHGVLAQAGISPAALGEMFDTMRRKHGDSDGVAAHFLSHPALGTRIEAAEAAVQEGAEYAPSMSAEDWTALQDICG